MISFTNKKFSLLQTIIFSIIIFIVTFSFTHKWESAKINEINVSVADAFSCNYNIKRLDGFKYVRPILFVEDKCESENLMGIKQTISQIIDRYKTNDGVTNTSVYLREYSRNEWMAINENETYEPGSLFKVPVLIAILKMNEKNAGFLYKKIKYEKLITLNKNVAYVSKTIQLGQTYTIKELLTYMIKYSDNAATILIENNMSTQVLQKLFSDVGIEVPNVYAAKYLFNIRDYSIFMRIIYNVGYLTAESSEFAAELLTQCDFKDGIVKGIPDNIKLSHKFGEAGNQIEKQIHETALVFLEGKPYLLTIMTKGSDNTKLCKLIAEISNAVYINVNNQERSI